MRFLNKLEELKSTFFLKPSSWINKNIPKLAKAKKKKKVLKKVKISIIRNINVNTRRPHEYLMSWYHVHGELRVKKLRESAAHKSWRKLWCKFINIHVQNVSKQTFFERLRKSFYNFHGVLRKKNWDGWDIELKLAAITLQFLIGRLFNFFF